MCEVYRSCHKNLCGSRKEDSYRSSKMIVHLLKSQFHSFCVTNNSSDDDDAGDAGDDDDDIDGDDRAPHIHYFIIA